jgi:hypothetical protein
MAMAQRDGVTGYDDNTMATVLRAKKLTMMATTTTMLRG